MRRITEAPDPWEFLRRHLPTKRDVRCAIAALGRELGDSYRVHIFAEQFMQMPHRMRFRRVVMSLE
jgi:hypothetical protein